MSEWTNTLPGVTVIKIKNKLPAIPTYLILKCYSERAFLKLLISGSLYTCENWGLQKVLFMWIYTILEIKTEKLKNIYLLIHFKRTIRSSGWCGSVDWAPACESKGHQFDSQSRAHDCVAGQVPSRGRMRGNHTLMFLSLSFSPLPHSKNNK